MKPTQEYLTRSILKWIFNSYVVTDQTPQELRVNNLVAETENSFLFGFMNTFGDEENVVITFDDGLLRQVREAVEQRRGDLVYYYLKNIRDYVVMRCTAQADNRKPRWLLTPEIFERPTLEKINYRADHNHEL